MAGRKKKIKAEDSVGTDPVKAAKLRAQEDLDILHAQQTLEQEILADAVKVTLTPVAIVEAVAAPIVEVAAPEPVPLAVKEKPPILPPEDNREMDRYICVIKNSEAAARISDVISHQRDLGLWGVHQFDNSSRNTYARSFYFRDRSNALAALLHAQNLR